MTCHMISEKQLSEMAYRYYKNYYSYEMDNEFALEDAVNQLLKWHADKVEAQIIEVSCVLYEKEGNYLEQNCSGWQEAYMDRLNHE